MGCNCNSQKAAKETYVWVSPTGSKTPYASKTEVEAKVARSGGTWQKA